MRKAGRFTAEIERQYTERLEMEIEVIDTMGFPGYFLIVADFINWAKDQDIPVGPGRGSGAGSLASYCMRITNIDPIPYGLPPCRSLPRPGRETRFRPRADRSVALRERWRRETGS